MAGVSTDESGAGRSFEGVSDEQQQSQCQPGEALVEWRSSEQVENGIPSTSPPYWDSDDGDDGGPKPSELYGKYTWKIDKFSQINKRELRSNAFEVGGYKWYILIYPQGCDVCNHLSLFLCVANHDKLLPGWSHFAQFTIAVVNKDPKKSKYSDTLHRFWKKEHDWGWKKFMEQSKVMDGFIDSDTLIIKAQVQVIRERSDRPFRCLDCQYRRELVRVYLTNVEQICRRFFEERRGKLGKLIEDKARWSSFCAFWMGMDQSARRRMSRERAESILKVVVKHFFIEKEVTSTLVMDSLYSGLKALESQNKEKKSKGKYLEAEDLPIPIISMEKDSFFLVDDVLLLLERAAMEPLPPKDEKGPQNRTKDGAAGEEFSKDSIERDERRLTELGRRTIEIFVLAQIFSKIEAAYKDAIALKRQEELIREEEAAWLAEIEQKARRGAADKEKKSKKKQAKQKKNNRKGKDKARDEKPSSIVQGKIEQDSHTVEREAFSVVESEEALEKSEVVEDVSDASDFVPEMLPLDSKGRNMSLVRWDTDTSEVQPPTEADNSGIAALSGVLNGVERGSPSAMDDSSSTCSSDSVPSVVINVPQRENSRHQKDGKSLSLVRNRQRKVTSDAAHLVQEPSQPSESVPDAGQSGDASQSLKGFETMSQAAVHSLQDRVVNGMGQHARKTEQESGMMHKISGAKVADVDIASEPQTSIMSSPRSPSKTIPSSPLNLVAKANAENDRNAVKMSSSGDPKQADPSVGVPNPAENSAASKFETKKFASSKPTEKPSSHQVPIRNEKPQHLPGITDKPSMPQIPVMSRPLSAPVIPGPRPAVPMVSAVQTAPILARSVSATGRLGPDPSASAAPSYVPHSYLNAIMGSSHVSGSSSTYAQNHPSSPVINPSLSYAQPSPIVSAPMFSGRMDPNPSNPTFSFRAVNNGSRWVERSQRDTSRNLLGDQSVLLNDMQSLHLYDPPHSRPQVHLPSEFPPGTSGRRNHVVADEFPHLDIINDLLDDEHVGGRASISNSGYHHSLNNGPNHLNRQFSFPGEPGMSRFDRMQMYDDGGFQQGYGSTGIPYDAVMDMIPSVSPRMYPNGQIDGLTPNQWQIGGSELPFMAVRNTDNDGYPYHHIPEYPNLPVGMNGYTMFRPSNGL